MLKLICGDLFKSDADIIAHGVNTRGAFGAGVAGQIARLYKPASDAYFFKYHNDGWRLGDVQIVHCDSRIIANIATQATYGKSGLHVDYDACGLGFSRLLKYAAMHQKSVAMPKIGSGLAGGDWDLIQERLEAVLRRYDVDVNVYYLL